MRIIFAFMIIAVAATAKAQTVLPGNLMNYNQRGWMHSLPLHDSSYHNKWSFSKYAGLSAGYSFFSGGSAMVVAASLALQVNRRLTNNFYAFAGVSVAPAYLHFNNAFLPADLIKFSTNNGLSRSGSLGMYSRAELGLMYVNDAKTFSISGSIGIEKNSYPYFYNPVNTNRQSPVVSPNR